jgi:hypothetical protein
MTSHAAGARDSGRRPEAMSQLRYSTRSLADLEDIWDFIASEARETLRPSSKEFT